MKAFIFIFLVIGLTCFVSSLSLDVTVPEEYSNVLSGEEVHFKIDVKYPENTIRQDLILKYIILDEDGMLIARSDTLKAIETQLSSLESLVVPEGVDAGLYSIVVYVEVGEDTIQEVSASFNVVDEKIEWFIIFLWVVFFGIIVYLSFLLRGFWGRFLIRNKVRAIVRERFGSGGKK